MARINDAALAAQDQSRKDAFTGMINKTADSIPADYSAKQKTDITSAEMGGIDVGFGNLKDEMMRRGSATGAYAGIPEALTEAGNQSIRQKADAGAQLQESFANVPVARAQAKGQIFAPALSGMLYDRLPSQGSGVGSSLIQGGTAAATTAIIAF